MFEKAPMPVPASHKWLRYSHTPFKHVDGYIEHDRKSDGILVRHALFERVKEKAKDEPDIRPRSNMASIRPTFFDVIALAEFTISKNSNTDAAKTKRNQLLTDASDVLMMQPTRGVIPALLFTGQEIAQIPQKRDASDNWSKKVCDVHFYAVERECLRRAIIKDCFGEGLSTLVTLIGLLSVCNEEMLTVLPNLSIIGLAQDNPLLSPEALNEALTDDKRMSYPPLQATIDLEAESPDLSPIRLTLSERVTGIGHIFGQQTTAYRAHYIDSSGKQASCICKLGWILDDRAMRELLMLQRIMCSTRAVQDNSHYQHCFEVNHQFEKGDYGGYQKDHRGVMFFDSDTNKRKNDGFKKHLPTLVGWKIFGRFGWSASDAEIKTGPKKRRREIVRRHREIFAIGPVGERINVLAELPAATKEAWLDLIRIFAKMMAELVSVIQWLAERQLLHRDISSSNVLFLETDKGYETLLIDFDCAKMFESLHGCQTERTGHLDCMAIDILNAIADHEQVTQLPRHDLESVLYLFLNLITKCMPVSLRQNLKNLTVMYEVMSECGWNSKSVSRLAVQRRSFIRSFLIGDETQIYQQLDLLPVAIAFSKIGQLVKLGFGPTNSDILNQDNISTFWIISSKLHDVFMKLAG